MRETFGKSFVSAHFGDLKGPTLWDVIVYEVSKDKVSSPSCGFLKENMLFIAIVLCRFLALYRFGCCHILCDEFFGN